MSNEQKLTDMVDFFRSKLADEQLRHADALTTAQAFQRELEQKNKELEELRQELEGYRVQSQDKVDGSQEFTDPY